MNVYYNKMLNLLASTSSLKGKIFSFNFSIQYRLPYNFGLTFVKLTGYVMHEQFNIQQLYALPTLYLCVLYLSENKQRLVPLTA